MRSSKIISLFEYLRENTQTSRPVSAPGITFKLPGRIRSLINIREGIKGNRNLADEELRTLLAEDTLDYYIEGGSTKNIERLLQGKPIITQTFKDYADSIVSKIHDSQFRRNLVDVELDLKERSVLVYLDEMIQGKLEDVVRLLGEAAQVIRRPEEDPSLGAYVLRIKYEGQAILPKIEMPCPNCTTPLKYQPQEGAASHQYSCTDCGFEGTLTQTVPDFMRKEEVDNIVGALAKEDLDDLSPTSIQQIAHDLQGGASPKRITARYGCSLEALDVIRSYIPILSEKDATETLALCPNCGGKVEKYEDDAGNEAYKCQSCGHTMDSVEGQCEDCISPDPVKIKPLAFRDCPQCANEDLQYEQDRKVVNCPSCGYEFAKPEDRKKKKDDPEPGESFPWDPHDSSLGGKGGKGTAPRTKASDKPFERRIREAGEACPGCGTTMVQTGDVSKCPGCGKSVDYRQQGDRPKASGPAAESQVLVNYIPAGTTECPYCASKLEAAIRTTPNKSPGITGGSVDTKVKDQGKAKKVPGADGMEYKDGTGGPKSGTETPMSTQDAKMKHGGKSASCTGCGKTFSYVSDWKGPSSSTDSEKKGGTTDAGGADDAKKERSRRGYIPKAMREDDDVHGMLDKDKDKKKDTDDEEDRTIPAGDKQSDPTSTQTDAKGLATGAEGVPPDSAPPGANPPAVTGKKAESCEVCGTTMHYVVDETLEMGTTFEMVPIIKAVCNGCGNFRRMPEEEAVAFVKGQGKGAVPPVNTPTRPGRGVQQTPEARKCPECGENQPDCVCPPAEESHAVVDQKVETPDGAGTVISLLAGGGYEVRLEDGTVKTYQDADVKVTSKETRDSQTDAGAPTPAKDGKKNLAAYDTHRKEALNPDSEYLCANCLFRDKGENLKEWGNECPKCGSELHDVSETRDIQKDAGAPSPEDKALMWADGDARMGKGKAAKGKKESRRRSRRNGRPLIEIQNANLKDVIGKLDSINAMLNQHGHMEITPDQLMLILGYSSQSEDPTWVSKKVGVTRSALNAILGITQDTGAGAMNF